MRGRSDAGRYASRDGDDGTAGLKRGNGDDMQNGGFAAPVKSEGMVELVGGIVIGVEVWAVGDGGAPARCRGGSRPFDYPMQHALNRGEAVQIVQRAAYELEIREHCSPQAEMVPQETRRPGC